MDSCLGATVGINDVTGCGIALRSLINIRLTTSLRPLQKQQAVSPVRVRSTP